MNHEMQDLARRAVACKHWRWMPGMRAVDSAERFRVSVVSHGYPQGVDEQPPMKVNVDLGLRWFPDLMDPATLGCLLALVREARGDDGMHIACRVGLADVNPRPSWRVIRCDGRPLDGAWHYTEAAALLAALETAP